MAPADERGIREPVQHYIEGMRTHKVDSLKKVFISRRSCAAILATS